MKSISIVKNLVSVCALSTLALVLAGCGGSANGTKSAPAPEPPAAPAAEAQGSVAPPDSGGIIVSPTGIKQNGIQLAYQTATSVWIPTGFQGSVSQITLNTPTVTGPPQSTQLSSVAVVFHSGAGFKVSPGSPAAWQCRASATDAWATCATQAGSLLPSLFTINASDTGSVVKPNGTTVPIGANVNLVIQ